jgi:hypothetical protein
MRINTAPYVACAILAVTCIGMVFVPPCSTVSASDTEKTLADSKKALADSKKTLAYACGYMAGQRAIWSRAWPERPVEPTWPDSCTPYKATAFAHGFTNE